MKCFNCGKDYDEKSEEAACYLVDEEKGEEVKIKNVSFGLKHQVLALCPVCVRAVTLGCVHTNYFWSYKIKDFPYKYVEENSDDKD